MRNFPRGTTVSAGSKPDGGTLTDTTRGSSSAEIGSAFSLAFDSDVVARFWRDEEGPFSARPINGIVTAMTAINVSAVTTNILFDIVSPISRRKAPRV